MPNHIQKLNFIPQVACEILQFKESRILIGPEVYLTITQEPDFFQACGIPEY